MDLSRTRKATDVVTISITDAQIKAWDALLKKFEDALKALKDKAAPVPIERHEPENDPSRAPPPTVGRGDSTQLRGNTSNIVL